MIRAFEPVGSRVVRLEGQKAFSVGSVVQTCFWLRELGQELGLRVV